METKSVKTLQIINIRISRRRKKPLYFLSVSQTFSYSRFSIDTHLTKYMPLPTYFFKQPLSIYSFSLL